MMPHLKGGLSCKPLISPFSAAVLHQTVVLLLLTTRCCAGQSQLVAPSQPIVATLGDDIILPCRLEPAVDASGMTVEWTRPDLNPRFVHVWRDGVELESKKHPSFRGRTSLLVNYLKLGDVSLKLSKVKLSDEGKYRCSIPALDGESTVELVVGVVSTIVISLARTQNNEDISGLVLQCESKGWYPEPEVSWLDSEGHVLSAGPTETVRGPDGLYTVSSRVTVEKRHRNSFTCRVQQKNINQTRETQIRIPEDVFMAHDRGCDVRISVVLTVVCLLLFAAGFFVFWKLRQKKSQNKMNHEKEPEDRTEETEQFIQGSTTEKDLDEEKLKEKEEEKEDMMRVISVLMERKKELENDRDNLKSLVEEVEREKEKNEKELESVSSCKKGDKKSKLLKSKDELEKEKANCETSFQKIVEKLQTTDDMIKRITERQKRAEEQIEQSKNHVEETKRQKDEIQLQSERGETNKNTDSLTFIDSHYPQTNEGSSH